MIARTDTRLFSFPASIASTATAGALAWAVASAAEGQPAAPAAPPAVSTVGPEGPPPPAAERYWGQWRGPLGTGVAPQADPPVEWGEGKNVRWKVTLPGVGHSTPVVWGEHVFVTVAVPFGEKTEPVFNQAPGAHDNFPVSQHHRFLVMALRRADGGVAWTRAVRETFPHEGGHYTGSLASNSPVTDGEHLIAFFGSRGLFALDPGDGRVLWEVDLGRMDTRHAHGEGSSPALHGDTVVVNWDHQGDSFIAAFDKRTGRRLWKTPRDEITSWSTPLVVEHGGRAQVVVSATQRVRGYDLATGELIWECGGLSRNVVASPVAGHGMVFAGNSYDHQAMLGIQLEGARGDITGTASVAWKLDRLTPYVPSPLLYGETLYFLRHNQGVLTALDARSGEVTAGPFRLRGIFNAFASPVGAAGRIYLTDRAGTTLVISHAKPPQFLALNELDDTFSASPAAAGRELYLRGEKSLYCIAVE